MNEILFQDSFATVQCQEIANYVDAYKEAMYALGIKLTDSARAPVTLHVSKNANLERMFRNRGLWLRQGASNKMHDEEYKMHEEEHMKHAINKNEHHNYKVPSFECAAFNPQETFYGKSNLSAQIKIINDKRAMAVQPGKYIKENFVNDIYIIDSKLRKRKIVSLDVLRRMAIDLLDNVVVVSTAMMNSIEDGSPINNFNAQTWDKEV
jgi:hypothetical protein